MIPYMKYFAGIVFDCDGVLIPNSERANIAAAMKTFTDRGIVLTEEERELIPGRSSKTFIPLLLKGRGMPESLAEELIPINRSNYDAIWPAGAQCAPGLAKLLLGLRSANVALAVSSMNRKVIIDRFIDSMLMIPNPFQVIVTVEDVHHHKPHPEPYQLAATRLGIAPEMLLGVDDMAMGVQSAKAAGLRCATIANAFNHNQDLSEADYFLGSLNELLP